MFLPPSKAE